ncbi:MAG: sigma-70 family RNA polymerase sigma factor [Myxococcales bacterium]|nr:sigma-70 family RNA polymerase sigma factor [Myxococcales bacterium]
MVTKLQNAKLPLDVKRCDALARQCAGGEESATRELVELLWPPLLRIVRQCRSLGAMRLSEDHVHSVAAAVIGKLSRPRGGGVRLYPTWRTQNGDKDFGDWLRIVVTNTARDHVRRELGPRPHDEQPSVKRLLNEFARSPALEEVGVRPPVTATETARQLLEFARTHLPTEQALALGMWLEGRDFSEVARDLDSEGPPDARRLVRAAIATLRREFVRHLPDDPA